MTSEAIISTAPDTTVALYAFQCAGRQWCILRSAAAGFFFHPITTRVPHAPPWLVGVTNVRSTITPVIALAPLIDAPARSEDTTSKLIVLSVDGAALGLLIDDFPRPVFATPPTREETRFGAGHFCASIEHEDGPLSYIDLHALHQTLRAADPARAMAHPLPSTIGDTQ